MSEGQADTVTACYGVTTCQKNDNAEEMLARAEAALEEARSNHSGTAIAV
jgi:GGDEF domain-containing protein